MIALITGASSLMAQATAKELESRGWSAILCGRSADMRVDVLDEASIDELMQKLEKVDALINIAGGIHDGELKEKETFFQTDKEDFDRVFNVNFHSVVNMTRAVLPKMINQQGGNIVNIVSGAALRGFPMMSAYSASKAAVLTFTQSLAQECGIHGIRANCVLPGFVPSRWDPDRRPMAHRSPLGRPTDPSDVAKAIAYLISEDAGHVSGACLDLSGAVALH